MMGLKVSEKALQEIVDEVDEDGEINSLNYKQLIMNCTQFKKIIKKIISY